MPLNLSLLSEYENAYLAGIETAARVAKKYNINIKYKSFFYGDGSLDILDEAQKIQTWKADLVIGPSFSDQFTLLKNYLPDVMVLSSYASGETLKSLPKNFYSVFLPDNQIMAYLANYIHKRYPEKNIHIITQTDCKQCVDVSKLFTTAHKKISSKSITETKIIMDNINTIDSKKLMVGHENDITLIFNVTLYAYNALVKHIAAAFPDKNFVFFSDLNNWGNNTDSNEYKKYNLNYESYRIGPLVLNESLLDFNRFLKAYYEIYQTKPKYDISYMNYITVMSAIEAYKKYYAADKNENMREKVLTSYIKATNQNSNWFKVNHYGIYRLTPKGEVLIAKLQHDT